MTVLETPLGASWAEPHAVNDAGQVAGTVGWVYPPGLRAVAWDAAGRAHVLDGLQAYGISPAGLVVGQDTFGHPCAWSAPNPHAHPLLALQGLACATNGPLVLVHTGAEWGALLVERGGSCSPLGDLQLSLRPVALASNGWAAGYTEYTYPSIAWRRAPGGLAQTLPIPPGYTEAYAYAVLPTGAAAGCADARACVWTISGQPVILASLSPQAAYAAAWAISPAGPAGTEATNPPSPWRAVLWPSPNAPVALDSLCTDAPPGMHLQSANAATSSSAIACTAVLHGGAIAVRLDPLP